MIKLTCFFCYLKFLYSKTNLVISSHLCSIMPGRINFMVSTTREGKIIILHIISPQKKIYISYHDREWKPHSLALPKLFPVFHNASSALQHHDRWKSVPCIQTKVHSITMFLLFSASTKREWPSSRWWSSDSRQVSHLSVYLISTAKVRVLVNTTTFITKTVAKPSKAKNNLWLLCYFGDSISFS